MMYGGDPMNQTPSTCTGPGIRAKKNEPDVKNIKRGTVASESKSQVRSQSRAMASSPPVESFTLDSPFPTTETRQSGSSTAPRSDDIMKLFEALQQAYLKMTSRMPSGQNYER